VLGATAGEVLWRFETSNVSGPYVVTGDDGTIYNTDNQRLWAINPDGTIKWTFDQAGGGKAIDFLADGAIVTGLGHTIWAINPDGTERWSYTWDGGFNEQLDSGPSVGPDGNIYAVSGTDGSVGLGMFSLTPDGELRWADEGDPILDPINASTNWRLYFTQDQVFFAFQYTQPGAPYVFGYDFNGNQTNDIDYTCTSAPKTDGVSRLLLAGQCGLQAIDPKTDSIIWNVGFGAVNMLPVVDAQGIVYSGKWHGPASAVDQQGNILWTSTSPDVSLQRTLAVSDVNGLFMFAGEGFGSPNWFSVLDTQTGEQGFTVPFLTVDGHNELSWSNEAALSPDESVAYFTTRFTSNGAPGAIWAVAIADTPDIPTPECPADASKDGVVDSADLNMVLFEFGCIGDCPADITGDGIVNSADLNMILGEFGATCE
jgi:hypothetical protein